MLTTLTWNWISPQAHPFFLRIMTWRVEAILLKTISWICSWFNSEWSIDLCTLLDLETSQMTEMIAWAQDQWYNNDDVGGWDTHVCAGACARVYEFVETRTI